LRPLGAQQRRELRSDLQLKIAEYWRQVNPLMILRSAAFDVNPFDRAALRRCPNIGALLRAML
jgi:hypothetical protein